jgi:hypothetical protein
MTDFNTIKWVEKIITGNFNKTDEPIKDVVENDDPRVLEWVLQRVGKSSGENGCSLCACAANFGSIENLKLLRQYGFEWDENTFTNAAALGDLDIVKWLKENNCPWSEETTYQAGFTDNMEVLEWLIDNKCPYDRKAIRVFERKSYSQKRLNFAEL